MEQAAPAQSPPIPPLDDAYPQSTSLLSNTTSEALHESAVYPSPVPEPNSDLRNPHPFDSSFVLDSISFDPPMSDAAPLDPLLLDPSGLDPSLFGASAFNLSRQAEHETEPFGTGLFWNPWSENVAQHDTGQSAPVLFHRQIADIPCTATYNWNAPSARVEPIAESDNIRHRLPSGQAYIRIVSKGRIIYRHPTAGQSYGKGRTRWELEREKNTTLRGGNKWAMWKDQDEWETAKWMATTKTSQSSLNQLLKTERVSRFQLAEHAYT